MMMMNEEEESRPPWWFAPIVLAILGVVALGLASLAFRLVE